ncbi:hypothetical protein ACFSOZ_02085 [Mesorhizobium newzealandense]|uniref:Uncharacterized protein n=1 Tax=Mesorhizobium newzealandense TaxID=1300302 RepID=A0ABW4U3A9_9HYPH
MSRMPWMRPSFSILKRLYLAQNIALSVNALSQQAAISAFDATEELEAVKAAMPRTEHSCSSRRSQRWAVRQTSPCCWWHRHTELNTPGFERPFSDAIGGNDVRMGWFERV